MNERNQSKPAASIVKLTFRMIRLGQELLISRCMRWFRSAGLVFLLGCAAAQEPSQPTIPAGELVRLAVKNEVADAEHPTARHFFRSRKQTPKGSQTRLYVETKDAMAGVLIAVNDQPLTPGQQRAEANHLNWLTSNPDQLRKKRAHEKEDEDRTLQIVKALPDAFLYEYAGTERPNADTAQAQTSAAPQIPTSLLRLNFRPNPAYSPPSRVEQALEGMRGYLVVDTNQRRIARIDGTLFKDVTFGWGIIGRLDKGGHFYVEQADLGDGTWEISEMKLSFTGKILLFKTLTMVSDEIFGDFRRVPDTLTFAQGAQMLEAEQANVAAPTNAKTTPQ